jgi:hypothetical protein
MKWLYLVAALGLFFKWLVLPAIPAETGAIVELIGVDSGVPNPVSAIIAVCRLVKYSSNNG